MNPAFITARARLDLLTIWNYIAEDSIDAADKVQREFEAAIARLAEMPMLGHTREDVPDPRYRFWNVYSYIIAYCPDTSPIQIIRVVSGYRDLTKLFE